LNAGQETSQWFQTETNPVPFKAAEGGNDDDAIHGVTAVMTSPAGIYNMMGQKVQQVRQGGIYIVNGKKVKF